MKILVVAAHPDDEVLGCGGTIARMSNEGNEIHIAILGEGITSRYTNVSETYKDDIMVVRSQCLEAATLLSIKDVSFFSFPDNRFDTVPLLDIIKPIEELIENLNPSIIYTHHNADLNIDHRITFQAVLTAARPLCGNPVKEIFSFEVPSSTEWTFNQIGNAFSPNVFTDINQTLDKKIQAIQLYKNEVRLFPHPRSPESIRSIAQRWGSVVGLEAAEPFQLVRAIR